jgi:hypothetical protein
MVPKMGTLTIKEFVEWVGVVIFARYTPLLVTYCKSRRLILLLVLFLLMILRAEITKTSEVWTWMAVELE